MKNQVSYEGMTFKPYISSQQIAERINTLAERIKADYAGAKPLFICVLNGAFPFASDLFRAVEDLDAQIAFVRLSSYHGTQSTGVTKEILGLHDNIEGRPVIIVEDIVDTGHTIMGLLKSLNERKPESLRVATLLFKPEALQYDFRPDYVGFEIPKHFIIGYGLDLNGHGRNLRDIYIHSEQA